MENAIFRSLIRPDGSMLAGLAAISGNKARFFVIQKDETEEAFIGRVSSWIKDQGGVGLDMQPPDVVPKGVPVGEVLMRLRVALGADRNAPEHEFDVKNPEVVLKDKLGFGQK